MICCLRCAGWVHSCTTLRISHGRIGRVGDRSCRVIHSCWLRIVNGCRGIVIHVGSTRVTDRSADGVVYLLIHLFIVSIIADAEKNLSLFIKLYLAI